MSVLLLGFERHEASGGVVLADFVGAEDLATHGDVDTRGGDLRGGEGHAEIEGGIALRKSGR